MILILGKNGAGKTYAANTLYQNGLCRSVNYTTRAPRENEQEGIDYHFVTNEEFLKLLNDGFFAEYKERYGSYYGTPINNLKSNTILVAGDIQKLSAYTTEPIIPIYIDVDISKRYKRVVSRGDSRKEVFARFHDENFSYLNDFSAIFIDNSQKNAVEQIMNIISKTQEEQFAMITRVQEFYSSKIRDFKFDGNEDSMLLFLKSEEYILRCIKLMYCLNIENFDAITDLYLEKIALLLLDIGISFEIINEKVVATFENQDYEIEPKFAKVLGRRGV